jgi:anti-sigma regulatory factor (Ser/Thr protein kinase)
MILKNNLEEIRRMAEETAIFTESAGIPRNESLKIRLIIEEIIVNTISYGYNDDSEHLISICLHSEGSKVEITIEDDSTPFDPFDAEPPDLDSPLEERRIGGHGIHLVKSLSESIAYNTENGKNITKIKLILPEKTK